MEAKYQGCFTGKPVSSPGMMPSFTTRFPSLCRTTNENIFFFVYVLDCHTTGPAFCAARVFGGREQE